MKIIALSEDSFRNLIITGSPYYPLINTPEIQDSDDEQAITLMIGMAENKPDFFLETLREANYYNNVSVNGMTSFAVAVFLAKASDYIKEHSDVKSYICELLDCFQLEDLMIVVSLLRSKYFGKGLGSFEQKLIKRIMEEWDYTRIQKYSETNSSDLKYLLRIIHPKYADKRGKLIKELR